jgi:2-polyprenyl-3-methyl-5-hydroxy-6-metoxy-1,4-benzoquinol methylase
MLRYADRAHEYPAWEWGSADVKERRVITRDRIGRGAKSLEPSEREVIATLTSHDPEPAAARATLASVDELSSERFCTFMKHLNGFAASLGLQQFTNWSKVWEYPWLWFHGLRHVDLAHARLVDLGSALSPLPWMCAMLGARVTLIETEAKYVPTWTKLRQGLRVEVDWHIVGSEVIPVPDAAADVYTSFSVIEHQPDKAAAVAEAVRVLKPGGLACVSFDICEPEMGMTFPAWNGRALTLKEFEDVLWMHPAFGNRERPAWNMDAIPGYVNWHRQSVPHHNYATGAAVMRKLA